MGVERVGRMREGCLRWRILREHTISTTDKETRLMTMNNSTDSVVRSELTLRFGSAQYRVTEVGERVIHVATLTENSNADAYFFQSRLTHRK